MSGQKKYSFHPNSVFRNYLWMNEQQRYLIFFRKFTFCRHKYSCLEHVLRTVYKTVGFYLILRFGAKMLLKDAVFQFFAEKMKRLFGEAIADKTIADTAMGIEINTIVFTNIYLLRRCLYSFTLEGFAD